MKFKSYLHLFEPLMRANSHNDLMTASGFRIFSCVSLSLSLSGQRRGDGHTAARDEEKHVHAQEDRFLFFVACLQLSEALAEAVAVGGRHAT